MNIGKVVAVHNVITVDELEKPSEVTEETPVPVAEETPATEDEKVAELVPAE